MTRVAHLDCFSGISGDMTLGALVDAGVELDDLTSMLQGLGLDGWSLRAGPVPEEHRIPGTRVEVLCAEEEHTHRHFGDIRAMIEGAELPPAVRDRAVAVFHRLAVAEGKIHGKDPEDVGFHEVGAVDSIVDIVGAVAGLHLLNVDRLTCSPLPLGQGTVRCQHGLIPVPAPATLELVRGVPTYPGEDHRELVTPTGAALTTTLADAFGSQPAMVIDSVGYGIGQARGQAMPNGLRLLVGEALTSGDVPQDTTWVLEANIDDLAPQFFGPLVQTLLDGGAQDAFLTPVVMKKGRPGVQLTVLCSPDRRGALEEVIFRETSTIGVRRHRAWRSCLEREIVTVDTPFGDVRVKVCTGLGEELNRMPEFEDCRARAAEHGVSILQVHRAALVAAHGRGETR